MKKTTKIIISTIFVLAIVFVVIYLNTNKLQNNKPTYQTLTFSKKELIELPITINGHKTKSIFDTGSDICVADISAVEKYKIKTIPFLRTLVNNSQWQKLGIIDSFYIGDFEFKNVLVVIIDFKSNNSALRCMDSDFIIGMPLISQLIWDFNFKQKEVQLSNEGTKYDTLHGNKLEYTSKNRPQLCVKIQNTEYKALMDFGNTGNLNLKIETSSTRSYNFKSTGYENIFGKYSTNGKKAIKDIILNKDTLRNISIDYSTVQTNNTNLIGLGVFSNYNKVVINPYKKALYLCEKHHCKTRTNYYYGFGFNIDRKDNTLLISYIMKGSSAFNKNIAIGDTIEKINNYSANSLCSYDYCDFVKECESIFQNDSLCIKFKNNDTLKFIRQAKIFP